MKQATELTDADFPIPYRGFRIYHATGKSVDHRNPVSGHRWSEPTFKEGFSVVGPGACSNPDVSTIEKAREQIDFIIAHPPAHAQSQIRAILEEEDQLAAQYAAETEDEDASPAPSY